MVATVGLGQVTVLSTQSAPTIAGHWSLSTNNGLLQGGNNFGATLTLGTADNFGLNIIANNVSVASATAAGSFTVGPTGSTNQNLTVNGTASTASAHRGGGGMVPVGAITAYNPGYYTATGNVSFTTVGPAGNTVAQVNTFLNASGWYVCDGTAVNNAASPIWNAAGRFLPKLDDSRFLQGSTTAGTVAGVASVTLTSANIPTLTSSGTVTSSGSTVANNTLAQSADHTHSASGLNYPGSAVAGTVGGTDGTHTHGTGYADANAATGGASGLMTFHSSASNNTLGPRTDAGTIIKANNSGHGHGFSLAAAAAGITGSTAGMSASHTHSIPSLSVNSGQTVSATYTNTATSFSILPTYLSTYFIVRVF